MYKDIKDINMIEAIGKVALLDAIMDMMKRSPGIVPWGAPRYYKDENKYRQILVTFKKEYTA